MLGRHCSEDDVCDDCYHASRPRQPNPDVVCHCCGWDDDDDAGNVSTKDAVINNNGYCPKCRDAECGEQIIGSPCRAVES